MTRFPTFQRWTQTARTPRSWIRLCRALFVLGVSGALIGFASNIVSASGCEADTRRAITKELGHGTALSRLAWLPASTLRDVSVELRHCDSRLSVSEMVSELFQEPIYFPPADVRGVWAFTRPRLFDRPFVVRVYYGHGGHSGCMRSAVRGYLNLFGLRLLIADDFLFIT